MPRHARVIVDLDAISHNVRALREVAGGAAVCAVVKADGYGHGAVEVARTALSAGARMLGVALVEEGVQLRDAGISAPILLLSEPPTGEFTEAFSNRLTPTLYHRESVPVAAAAARARGGSSSRWAVHLKVDTGMHRVGALPVNARDLAAEVHGSSNLILDGTFTHLAVADEPQRPETSEQLALFAEVVNSLRVAGIDPGTLHAANSAGTIAHPDARLDMVRCGIAVYGIAPSPLLDGLVPLRPALSVETEVSHTASVRAGEGVSYGLAHRFEVDTDVAVLPVGYADGVPRDLGLCGGEVLIGGIPRPIRGVVTMDQLVVDLGPTGSATSAPVRRGDHAVLIGTQGASGPSESGDAQDSAAEPVDAARISAWDWAQHTGTIAYEVVCGLSTRLPRSYHTSGDPGARL